MNAQALPRSGAVLQYNHNHGDHGHFASGGLAGHVNHVRTVRTMASEHKKAAVGLAAIGAIGAMKLAGHVHAKRLESHRLKLASTHDDKKRAFAVERSQRGFQDRVDRWVKDLHTTTFDARVPRLEGDSEAGQRAIAHAYNIASATGVPVEIYSSIGARIAGRLAHTTGSYSHKKRRIQVLGKPTADSLAVTLFHEHAHAFEHRTGHLTSAFVDGQIANPKEYYAQEIVAESVAHILARSHGLDASRATVAYVGNYHLAHVEEGGLGINDPEIQARIRQAAAQMMRHRQ